MFTEQTLKFFGLEVYESRTHHGFVYGGSRLEVGKDMSIDGTGLISVRLYIFLLRLLGKAIIRLWYIPKKFGLLATLFANVVFPPLQYLSNIVLLPIRLLVAIFNTLPLFRYIVGVAEKVLIIYLIGKNTTIFTEFVPYIEKLTTIKPEWWGILFGLPFLSLLNFPTLKTFLSNTGRVFESINYTYPIYLFREGRTFREEKPSFIEELDNFDYLFTVVGQDPKGNSLNKVVALLKDSCLNDESLEEFLPKNFHLVDFELDTNDGFFIFSKDLKIFLVSQFSNDEKTKWLTFKALYKKLIICSDPESVLDALVFTLDNAYGYDVYSSSYYQELVKPLENEEGSSKDEKES